MTLAYSRVAAFSVAFLTISATAQPADTDSPLVAAARKGRSPDRFHRYSKVRPGDRAPAVSASHWKNGDGSRRPGKPLLINFWSIACGPCIEHLPRLGELAATFGPDVDIVALHKNGDPAKVARFVEQNGVTAPTAIDTGDTFERFGITGVPTYVLVDRSGLVRLKIHRPPSAAQMADLLDVPGRAVAERMFIADVKLKKNKVVIAPLKAGDAMSEISAASWLNSPPLRMHTLRGKVLLIDFWATWCAPCVANLPTIQAYAGKFGSALTIIGVHYASQPDAVTTFIAKNQLRFPVAIDNGDTWERLAINYVPTYLLVDAKGFIRFKDKSPPSEERIIALIRETR